jgi:hypothetical protein
LHRSGLRSAQPNDVIVILAVLGVIGQVVAAALL